MRPHSRGGYGAHVRGGFGLGITENRNEWATYQMRQKLNVLATQESDWGTQRDQHKEVLKANPEMRHTI